LVALGCGACVGPLEVQQQVWLVVPLGELLVDQIEYNKRLILSISIKTMYSLVHGHEFQMI
jgi:hypothetical protein